MKLKNAVLHLSLIKNIGPGLIRKIIEIVGFDSLDNIYQFSIEDFERFGVSSDKAETIFTMLKDSSLLDQELKNIDKVGAEFLTPWCSEYPYLLKQIPSAPVVLYFQGDISLFSSHKMIAVVGARKAHSYAQDALQKIILPMVNEGWTIVSGGAFGADALAHKIALENKGKTIIVSGSGLYYRLPSTSRLIYEETLKKGGLIVSAFPVMKHSDTYTFPARNRIISGLSVGCLVLQAASKSGALITAKYAVEQGREVFAVPGPLYDPLSAGCHNLIKQGAKLATTDVDILEELDGFKSLAEEKQSSWLVKSSKFKKEKDDQFASYDEHQQMILRYTVSPISLTDLSLKINIEPALLNEKLFDLALDGKIEQDCMGLFKRL